MKTTLLLAACLFAASSPTALGQCPSTFTEGFDGSNEGGWSWNSPVTTLQPNGGNPGPYLFSGFNDTIAPQARTQLGLASEFHGDYRARGVTSLGIDLISSHIDFPNSCLRPLSLILKSDMGTPGVPGDDCFAYFVMAENTPCLGDPWTAFDVAIPAQSGVLPAGWLIDPNCAIGANAAWNAIIQDVDQVSWFFGDPTFFFIFRRWDTGMDNARITSVSSPVSYCTSGTSANGCQATLSASGTPSATAPSGFVVSAAGAEGNKNGIFFFGTNGRQANPWGNGTSFQCVVPPVSRAGLIFGTGTSGACDGAFSQDLNARWTAKPSSNPGAGATTQVQLWYRDPQNTSNQTTSLSSALEFLVCP